MARYMVQFSYNSEAVTDLVKNPQNVAAQVSSLAESIDGKIESFYFTFGEYDGVAIAEMPDNVTMAAISMACAASGSFKSFRTTVLLTPEEAMGAMRQASTFPPDI
jgi:uncharacterized protein with GYD domain